LGMRQGDRRVGFDGFKREVSGAWRGTWSRSLLGWERFCLVVIGARLGGVVLIMREVPGSMRWEERGGGANRCAEQDLGGFGSELVSSTIEVWVEGTGRWFRG
jgi:hypothetical protein